MPSWRGIQRITTFLTKKFKKLVCVGCGENSLLYAHCKVHLINHEETQKMNTIGQRLKYMIEKTGISQAEVARYCHVDPALISKYCKDVHEPKGKNLTTLCICLDCSVDWLLHGKGSEDDHFNYNDVWAKASRVERRVTLEKEGKDFLLTVKVTPLEIKDMFSGVVSLI